MKITFVIPDNTVKMVVTTIAKDGNRVKDNSFVIYSDMLVNGASIKLVPKEKPKDMVDVVRCKDCGYNAKGLCKKRNGAVNPDGFCEEGLFV